MLTPYVIAVYAATALVTPAIAKTVANATGFTKAIKKQPVLQDIDEEEIEPIDWEEETVDPSI